jgi:hypothetical protein
MPQAAVAGGASLPRIVMAIALRSKIAMEIKPLLGISQV